MKKTILLIAVLFIAVIVVSSLYFSRLNQTQNASKRYIAAIPASASLLVSFNNDSAIYDLFQEYEGFELIFGKDELKELSILRETFLKNASISTLIALQPVYLSFHAQKDSIHWLLSIPHHGAGNIQDVLASLDSTISINTIKSSNGEYYELTVPEIPNRVYASLQPENVMFTFSQSLLEDALNQDSDHLSELFLEKFQENNNRNTSPLQLYINHERLKGFLDVIKKRNTGTLDLFEALNGITMLDLNYKSDVVMFSGISSITSSDSSSYLNLFLSQEPVSHQLKNWVPKDVAEVITYGISDYSLFHSGLIELLEKRKELSQLREQIRYIEADNEVVIADELLPVWGNEFANITLKSGEKIGLIAVRDSLEYAVIADKISTINADSTSRHFDNSNLLYYSFGDPFKEFQRPFFTYANGYMIVANQRQTLIDYLENIKNESLLIQDEDFILYEKLQSTSSNFSLFIHRENANRMIERNLSSPFLKNYKNAENFGYNRFYGFSLQLSGTGEEFLVNLYGQFDAEN